MFLRVLMERTVVRTWKRPASAVGYQFCRSTAALNLNWFATCHVQSGVSGGHIMKKSFPEYLLTCRWVFLIHTHVHYPREGTGPIARAQAVVSGVCLPRSQATDSAKLVRLSSQAS